MHFTSTSSPSFTTSVTLLDAAVAPSRLMWSRPSVPGKISTNAPKSVMRLTVPL